MISALGFLTIIGRGHAPNRTTLGWFPVVGAMIGATLALVHVGASELWAWPMAGALVVAADLALTGMLHFDGLADAADGLLPHMDRQRRLDIMSKPNVGAFALTVVPAVLLLRWASISALEEPWTMVGLWALTRTSMVVVIATVPYAREKGLASAFGEGAHRWHALWLVPAAGGVVAFGGVRGAVAVAVALATVAGVVAVAVRRVRGFTGDVLGAAAVLAETTALVVLAVQ